MRVFFEIRIGEEGDLRRRDVELEKIELRADLHAPPQSGRGDAEQCWNAWIIAGVDEIDRAGEPLAVRQRVEGLAVFGGGHSGRMKS